MFRHKGFTLIEILVALFIFAIMGVLAAMEVIPIEESGGWAALGELSLDGRLNPVAGVLPAAIAAHWWAMKGRAR